MPNNKLIMDKLEELYPDAHCELIHNNEFQLLIAVILSAQTTDERVNSVTPELFEKYPDPLSLMSADIKDIERILKPLGLYHNKAKSVISCCEELCERFNGEVPRDRISLESLRGVGRKTANVVLSNCFDTPAFAVDTHVKRVSWRLGIADKDDDVRQVEEKLMTLFPKESWGKLHHQFIFFGRYLCKAAKPLCDQCPLRTICCDKVS